MMTKRSNQERVYFILLLKNIIGVIAAMNCLSFTYQGHLLDTIFPDQ